MAESDNDRYKITLKVRGGKKANDVRATSNLIKRVSALMRTGNRPAAHAGGKARGGKPGRGAGRTGATHLMQRCNVRMTYAANKGDGQWAAHGRYIARESATLGDELEKSPDDIEREAEGLTNEKERDDDRYDRAVPRAGWARTLRQSYLAEIGGKPEAKTLNGLRSLSGVGVVHFPGRGEVLLPGDAPGDVEHGGTERADALRRGSYGKPGAGAATGRGAGRLSSETLGFGATGDIPLVETLDAWQKSADPRVFKLILSPEFGDKMDMRQLTRDYMDKLERDLGVPLEWCAAAHYNTDHPHVHIALRGRDRNGHELRIDPSYVKTTLRQRAQEAATQQIGVRTDQQMEEALDRQVQQQRYTDLDRMILKKAARQPDGAATISYGDPIPKNGQMRELRVRQIRRLAYLEKMGMAERTGPMAWRLPGHFEHALRNVQVSNDRLKTMYQNRKLLSDPRLQLQATDMRQARRVAGRLIATGIDEARDAPYMLVEGIDGKVHYLYQSRQAQQARGEGLKVGHFVVITADNFTDPKDGKEKLAIRFKHLGAADALLKDPRHLAGEAMRTVSSTGRLPEESGFGGWLGQYQRAVRAAGQELLERGKVRPAPEREGLEVAPRQTAERTPTRGKDRPRGPSR